MSSLEGMDEQGFLILKRIHNTLKIDVVLSVIIQ